MTLGIRFVVLASLLATVGCGAASPTAATPITRDAIVVQRDLDYDINIPSLAETQRLQLQYPNGVRLAPMTAQQEWNYTDAYHGSANVYYGPLTGDAGQYVSTGIVIAPVDVARMDTFLGAAWPTIGLDPAARYTWVGRFVFTTSGTR